MAAARPRLPAHQHTDEIQRRRIIFGLHVKHSQPDLNALPQKGALLRGSPMDLLLADFQLQAWRDRVSCTDVIYEAEQVPTGQRVAGNVVPAAALSWALWRCYL